MMAVSPRQASARAPAVDLALNRIHRRDNDEIPYGLDNLVKPQIPVLD
jgi:hypothetical protein